MVEVVITFYPYITDKDNEMQLMDTELCVHRDVPDESDSPGFESIGEAKEALPTLAYRLLDDFGRLEEDFAGFGILASDGYRWYIKRGEYERMKHDIRYIPYAEDNVGKRHFLDVSAAFENTTNPERAWNLPTLEAAKRKLPYVHRTLLDDCVVGAFAKVGVVCSDDQVFSEWRQLPLQTGNPDEFYLYVEGVQGRKFFYKETGIETLPTLDWSKAKKFSTAEDARAVIPEFTKQPIVSEIPRSPRYFCAANGVGDLIFVTANDNRFYPYVLDTYGDKGYLVSSQGESHDWTHFVCNAQAYPTVELAKENIQRLVDLVREDDFFDKDFYVGVADAFDDTVFEDYIVGPVPSIYETEDSDPVNNPEHYKTEGLEAIAVVEAFFADNYLRGNVFKYIARAGKKDPNKKVEDLQKAAWYLNREIEALKGDCA